MRHYLIVLLSLFLAFPALAADDSGDKGLYLSSSNVLRGNPIGLQSQNQLMYQKKLMDSDSVLFSNTFIEGGLLNRVSPAFVTGGVGINIQPIALFKLSLGVEAIQYFGGFDQLMGFSSPDAEYDSVTMENRAIDGDNNADNGLRAFGKLKFQLKVKQIALVNETGLEKWMVNITTGEDYFYEFTTDTLAPNNGLMMTNDVNLLYLTKKGAFGLRHSMVKPMYDVETEGVNNGHSRAGLIGIIPFKTKDGSNFSSRKLVVVGNYYLNHRYRSTDGPDLPVYGLLVYSFEWAKKG